MSEKALFPCGHYHLRYCKRGNHDGLLVGRDCSKEDGTGSCCGECRRTRRLINHRRSTYNLSEPQFLTKLVLQDSTCAICQVEFANSKDIKVDHNHDNTGQVRALLCNLCNLGLGYFHEDIASLDSAISYLKEWKS